MKILAVVLLLIIGIAGLFAITNQESVSEVNNLGSETVAQDSGEVDQTPKTEEVAVAEAGAIDLTESKATSPTTTAIKARQETETTFKNEVTPKDMSGVKKYKDIKEYSTDDWIVAETGTEGVDYTLLRINKGLVEAIGHPEYPIRVGVAVPVDSLKEENTELYAIEDMLTERLETTSLGVQVMTVSRMDGQQFKEFVFYTKTTIDFKKLHEDLMTTFPKYDVQFYAEQDSTWSLYADYVM